MGNRTNRTQLYGVRYLKLADFPVNIGLNGGGGRIRGIPKTHREAGPKGRKIMPRTMATMFMLAATGSTRTLP